jgi:hypothetical protein
VSLNLDEQVPVLFRAFSASQSRTGEFGEAIPKNYAIVATLENSYREDSARRKRCPITILYFSSIIIALC